MNEPQEPIIKRIDLGDGDNPPDPIPQPDLEEKRSRAMRDLVAQYQGAVRAGERISFRTWLGRIVGPFMGAHPRKVPSDAIESEGLGPIGWIFLGWGVWDEGWKDALTKELIQRAVEWIIDSASELNTPIPPDPPGPAVDMNPPGGVDEPPGDPHAGNEVPPDDNEDPPPDNEDPGEQEDEDGGGDPEPVGRGKLVQEMPGVPQDPGG